MKISKIEVSLVNHMGSDLSVVNAARVSFNKHHEFFESGDEKLIRYLAKHKHTSPFNHAFITMRVKAPIFVARQLVKHKFMPWNEVSRRYVDEEPEFFIPDVWRAKADNVKQGSGEAHEEQEPEFSDSFHRVTPFTLGLDSVCLYNEMIKDGYAAEQARMVLPQNTMTEWIWSGTLGAYCDMLRLRLDPHTQYESRIVAEKIYNLILPLYPVSVKALLENES